MIKKDRYLITGIDQDTAPDKRDYNSAYDAENIRIVNNGRHMSVKPIKEPSEFSTPDLPTTQVVIGGIEVNGDLYIFTTDNIGNDYIRKIDSAGVMTTILTGDFNFNSINRIEAIANYENDAIIKIYWTDGVNQLRFINVINPSPNINLVEDILLNQPLVEVQSGGDLIAGNIQYAYSLYNLNGSESVLSPLSEMLSLTNYMQGYESGESSGLSVELTAVIDTNFEYIRVYSILYQELNQTPIITLIADEAISSSSFLLVDDGNNTISELSNTEFVNIGSRPLVVQTLAPKRNRLFVGDVTETNFDPDIDVRAFAHAKSSTNYRVKNADGSDSAIRTLPTVPNVTHDSINYDYNTYRFLQSSTFWGVEGVNIKVKLVYDNSPLFDEINGTTNSKKSLKRGEIYRIGIIFFNSKGQRSPAKWITDIKMPSVDDVADAPGVYDVTGLYNTLALEVTLKNQSSYTSLGIQKYQLVAVERGISDRTIISQGVIQPTVRYYEGSNFGNNLHSPYYHPYYITKDIKTVASTSGADISKDFTPGVDWIDLSWSGSTNDSSYPEKNDEFCVFYSSDTLSGTELPTVSTIRILGSYQRSSNNGTTKLERYADNVPQGFYIENFDPIYTALNKSPYPGDDFPYTLLSWSDYGASSSPIDVYEMVYLHRYDSNFTGPATSGSIDISLEGPIKNVTNGSTVVYDSSYTISNSVNINNLYTRMNSIISPAHMGTQSVYSNEFVGCSILKFNSTTWHTDSISWDKFITDANRHPDRGNIPIVELVRTLTNQYGGATYEAKQRNSYLIEGTLGSVSDITTNYVGDIYIAPFAFQRSNGNHSLVDQSINIYDYVYIKFLEHNSNVIGRKDSTYQLTKALSSSIQYQNFSLEDHYQLLTAYNQKPTLILAPSKPANFNTVNSFPNVVQASQEKFSNELIDSWTKFPTNETQELEGIYGSISKLYNFKGEIYSLQDTAVAVLSINPRIQTQGSDGVSIELGIGDVLYDYRYLTTVTGTTDKFSVVDDGNQLFFYDRIYNTITSLDGTKVSTMKSVKNILENTDGVAYAVYNRENDEILFSVNAATDFTLVYDTLLNKFVSRDTHGSFYDQFKYVFGNKILIEGDHLTPSGLLELYSGTDYKPTSITYLFSPAVGTEKVFHNLEYRMYGDVDIEQVQVTGNLNSSALETVTPSNKFDIKRVHLPRISGTRQRFREPYILVEIKTNTGVTKGDFSLDDMVIMYNIKG